MLCHLLECYANDLPHCRICDGNVPPLLWGVVVDCGFEDLIPQVKAIYDTGFVDCSVEGPYEEVVANIGKGLGRGFDIRSTAPRDIVAFCKKRFI